MSAPLIRPGVVVEWFDGAALAFEPETATVAMLDEISARLLECLDGSIALDTLVTDIADAADLDLTAARQLLDVRVAELAAAQLVVS